MSTRNTSLNTCFWNKVFVGMEPFNQNEDQIDLTKVFKN